MNVENSETNLPPTTATPVNELFPGLEPGIETSFPAVMERVRDIVEPKISAVQREIIVASLANAAVRNSYIKTLRSEINEYVREARDAGATWKQIAESTGISISVAMRRWDPVQKEKHASYQRSKRAPSAPE